jgi:hypothetical protein
MQDPLNLGHLEPITTIESSVDESLLPGRYYYFPFFGDTRIYLEALDHSSLRLLLEDLDDISFFTQNLLEVHLRHPEN